MRIFDVGLHNEFTEYERVPFEADHEESVLEEWIESNPGGILKDGLLLIIGRQVETDLSKWIDLLGVDREGNVVVVELKRDRTPRDVIAQALAYAAYAARLDVRELEGILRKYHDDELLSLADHHRKYFNHAEAVAFNKDQRIVIVGQQVTPEIRQTAWFLGSKGFQVTCVEFTFFRDSDGRRLLSQEIVVDGVHTKVSKTHKTAMSKAEFIETCDVHGRAFYPKFFKLASQKGMSIRSGTSCFLVEADVDVEEGAAKLVCKAGLPDSKYGQAIQTALGSDYWGIRTTGAPIDVVDQLWTRAEHTGLFTPAGMELRCLINRAFADDEMDTLVAWCASVTHAIREQAGVPASR